MKKNTLAIIIAALLVVIAGVLIWNNRYLTTIRGEAADFTVYDTASITKLFFADKRDHQVLLERTEEGWMVDNHYQASQQLINDMLKTLNRLRIRMPVSLKKSDNVITRMSSNNIKVEVYQIVPRINLFNKIKLFKHETRTKVFYVGDDTQDNNGSFVLKEGADKAYIVHIHGVRGFISSRFSANPIDWRDHIIFNCKMADIQSVKLEIYNDPANGFVITENGRYQFKMHSLDGKDIEYDTLRVLNLMSSFNEVRFESFLNDVSAQRRDSIINSPFQQRLTVTTKDGESRTITTFKLLANADMYDYDLNELDNPEIDKIITDPDHQYALLSEGNEFVMIQKFVFGKLLKPAEYYRLDHVEPVKVVSYKELETVESR